MKKLSLLFILVCHFSISKAQTSSTAAPTTALNSFSKQDEIKALTSNKMRNVTSFDNRYEGVKGAPFYPENWSEGRLILSDSSLVKNKFLYKFDCTNNELWVKMTNGDERIIYSREISSFDLNNGTGKSVKFKKMRLPTNPERHHFAISLYEGAHILLFKDLKKVFHKADLEDKGLVTVGHPYDWFEDITTFYIKKGNNDFVAVPLKKNDIIESLKLSKANSEFTERFCKMNSIKGKLSEEEAVKVLNYVDTLLQQ